MSTPAQWPLTIRVGDTETVTLYLQDVNGAAINVTGRTYAAQIRSTADATSVLATFTCAISNAAGGIVTATLPAATTAALTPGVAVFDLQETNSGVVTTLLAGPVTIVQDVTR